MSYQVTCSFDLKNASRDDYQAAYADLAALGLSRTVRGSSGKELVLPTTTTLGIFNGASAEAIREFVRSKVVSAFQVRGFKAEIFVAVGGENHTWVHQLS